MIGLVTHGDVGDGAFAGEFDIVEQMFTRRTIGARIPLPAGRWPEPPLSVVSQADAYRDPVVQAVVLASKKKGPLFFTNLPTIEPPPPASCQIV